MSDRRSRRRAPSAAAVAAAAAAGDCTPRVSTNRSKVRYYLSLSVNRAYLGTPFLGWMRMRTKTFSSSGGGSGWVVDDGVRTLLRLIKKTSKNLGNFSAIDTRSNREGEGGRSIISSHQRECRKVPFCSQTTRTPNCPTPCQILIGSFRKSFDDVGDQKISKTKACFLKLPRVGLKL